MWTIEHRWADGTVGIPTINGKPIYQWSTYEAAEKAYRERFMGGPLEYRLVEIPPNARITPRVTKRGQ